MKKFKQLLGMILCSTLIAGSSISVYATDEYGMPYVTATPIPEQHTEYYSQPADTDSIEGWPQGPQIEAEAAVLMDMVSGAILYSKNADKVEYPASITKIMTGLLGCESLNPSDKFAMSETAAHGITDAQSSSIYADTGEEFTIEQALMAVMLQSANEMTLAIAEQTSGSVKKFVEQMNLKARQLGCTNTHFNNPNGLPDERHYTTANDMAKIARAAWNNRTFRKFVTTGYYEIPPTNKFAETRYLLNHHKMMEGQAYAYNGVLGGKTGYTEAAGNTLVTFAKNDNTYLVSVVLKSINGAYADTAALLNYGFDNFQRVKASTPSGLLPTAGLPFGRGLGLWAETPYVFKRGSGRASVTLPTGADTKSLNTSSQIIKNPAGPPLIMTTYSYNGHPVGTARYYQQLQPSDLF